MSSSTPIQLDLERHTLANGLRVVLHRDPALPLVAIDLWYHVGSKNERPGRTGFAHLFEHLLFQGSEHVGTNDHFRLVQQAGGVANGSTWYDRTNYYETLPERFLDLGLWLEADRMGFFLPAIDQEKLDNQRDVVINERRQRIDNQPYGRAWEGLQELLYPPGHPYRWPVIGYVDDLRQASLDDVCEFFGTYYRPDNAVLTLAGDFEIDDAMRRVERYFGDIAAGGGIERPEPAPPRLGGEQRVVQEDDIELPRIYAAWHVPAFGTADWYAADLLSTVLAGGKASLLYEDLVHRRQLAQDVHCFVLPTELSSTFALIATARPGADLGEIETALDAHVAGIAAGPPAEERLERARRQLLTDHFEGLQTLERRADLLAMFTTYFDRPEAVAGHAERYREITATDLSALAAAHLDPARRAMVTVVPREPSAEPAS